MISNDRLLFSKFATFLHTWTGHILVREIATADISQPLIGPAVKLLLFHYNLAADSVANRSGPKKNILKSDVLGHISAKKLSPVKRQKQPKLSLKDDANTAILGAPLLANAAQQVGKQKPRRYTDIPLNNMRQTISRRLSQSKSSIPHAYVTASIRASKVQKLRAKLSELAGLKLSLNDFVIKACAHALQACPEINVQWKDNVVRQIPSVDISVAVATPGGLITPILFGANKCVIAEISVKLRELAGRARDGKLRPEEFQGGTFTISNLGMFGSVTNFTAIINPPQAAILAVGGMAERTISMDKEENSHFGATLCYDGRAIQDQDAHRFMDIFAMAMAEPNILIAGLTSIAEETPLDLDNFDGFTQQEEQKNGPGSGATSTVDMKGMEMMARLL